MKRSTVLMVVSVILAVLAAACGNDKIAPSDPGSSAIIPDTVFFNDTGSGEVILFSGRATDNRWVETVQISFDNGATWHTADIDADPSVRDVRWSYYAVDGDMPSPSMVLIRVADQDGNETTSSPFTVQKSTGSTTTDLLNVFSSAATGDVIALSSGAGDAYGDSGTALTIPIDTRLTVLGAGYGSAATSGGITPSVASTATILEAPVSTAALFSVGADLTVRNMRLVGSAIAIRIAGVDATVIVEDGLFDGQEAWAIRAAGEGGSVNVQFLSSGVDASRATSSSRGGLYLEEVFYEIAGSAFYYMTDPLGPGDGTVTGAAVQVVGSSGIITGESLFEDNALAIWASGGSPIISSCNISGAGTEPTYGINLTGDSGTAEVRRNIIDGNSGYGLRVGGERGLHLRRNAITGNRQSGVYIDSLLPNGELVNIDMGTVGDQGRNLLDNNTHPSGVAGYDTQVYVTQATSEGAQWIPANWNYWGYTIINDINFAIIDDGDNGGGRATIAVGSFYTSTSEVGP